MIGNGKPYTSNVDDTFHDAKGDEIRVKVGQTFTGLDDGTADFLIGQGKISAGRTAGLGTAQAEMPDASAGAVETMTRDQLLRELGTGMTDTALRDAVRDRREREGRAGASLLGGGAATSGSGKPAPDPFADLSEEDRATAAKLMKSSETTLRKTAETEKVPGVTADHDKADIVRLIIAKRAADAGGDTFDATAFVDRNLDEISDAELADLSEEDRTAVRAAEEAKGDAARKGLLERLDALDAPAS